MLKQTISDALFDFRCRLHPEASIFSVRLPLDPILSRPLRQAIAGRLYERNEMDIVIMTLEPNDRVLECGAGIGLLSSYCAMRLGSDRVRTVEANPFMAPLIARTFDMNKVRPALVVGAIGPVHGQIDFHVRHNFWASSAHPDRADGAALTISVPLIPLHDEILRHRPSYLFIDIEGGEEQLTDSSDLPGVSKVMAEVHPELIGAGVDRFVSWLQRLGFVKNEALSHAREFFFVRPALL